ncbi:MAG: hypothetical protein ACF8OB_02095 [Phycisphaeraceae bacterium JB051]
MDQASLLLVKMQYLEAEKLCEQALKQARERKLWAYLARITLPLQECRRQRRMIAAEGHVVLGTDHLGDNALSELLQLDCGCVVFTGKDATGNALRLMQNIRKNSRHLLVLAATVTKSQWTLHSAVQPILTITYPAPPADWQHKTLEPGQWTEVTDSAWPTPGDWFLDVLEKLGDQALKAIEPKDDTVKRVDALLASLQAVTDHEILHQQLAKAANAMVR